MTAIHGRRPRPITAGLLGGWPLPDPDAGGDKRARGLVVCVGGSAELPGAMVLAGTAALRAGAGTVRLGVPSSIGLALGVAVPEALVFGLRSRRDGGLAAASASAVAGRAGGARAVLIGPGLAGPASLAPFLRALLPRLRDPETVILDAHALDGAARLAETVRSGPARAILTPHAGEMARLLGLAREQVEADALGTARQAAATFGAVVVLKGPQTLVVAPDGAAYRYQQGDVGLATSGSGDTLAGLIAGLAGRGAEAAQAAVWGVYLHGTAGNHLRRRLGRLGYLGRELVDEVPLVLAELDTRRWEEGHPAG